jgi:hypothetical protein
MQEFLPPGTGRKNGRALALDRDSSECWQGGWSRKFATLHTPLGAVV